MITPDTGWNTDEPRLKSEAAVARYNREKAEKRRLQAQALELIIAGHTHRQIAAIQGCAINTVVSRVRRAHKALIPQTVLDQSRQVVLDRIQQHTLAIHTLMGQAMKAGDIEGYCKLQDRAVALLDRLIRVQGLEAPKKLIVDAEVTQVTEQDRELREMINEAKARNANLRVEMTGDPTDG